MQSHPRNQGHQRNGDKKFKGSGLRKIRGII
jgi:hypothetical protein